MDYIAYGLYPAKGDEMKHFFIVIFLCAAAGLLIGVLLSKAAGDSIETLMPKNSVIVETYR
jgi:preprotein translocase subunit SecG